jgi:hypothetical protein
MIKMAWRGDRSGAGWRSPRPHSGYYRTPYRQFPARLGAKGMQAVGI